MITKWKSRWARASLDLPVSIIGQERFDHERDQLFLIKSGNHCFTGLYIISDSKSNIRITDGNNTYYSDISVRDRINQTLSSHLGWNENVFIPVRCNFGARMDLSGAASIMAALALSLQYKGNIFRDVLNVHKQLRQKILMDLKSNVNTHDDELFIPSASRRCTLCSKWFRTEQN